MPEHLNPRQLQGYKDRTLPVGELMAVDAHLGGCAECRAFLAMPAEDLIAGIDQARFRHLSYEQMDDWVEDRLDPAGRELVMAHIGVCSPCARQLIAYQEYASAMAAPIRTMKMQAAQPVEAQQPWWSFLKQPQYALGAAALMAFFIITPLTRHQSVEPSGAILAPTGGSGESKIPENGGPILSEALGATELDNLPDSVRQGTKELLNAPESASRPAALNGLESTSGGMLESPVSEVVEETRPVMSWKAFGQFYSISLYDSRHGLVSRRGGLKETRWTPPSALVRGDVYTWEVESGNTRYRGMFRVLGENQLADLKKVRAEHGSSHAVMGAVEEELGLLTAARQEFEAMAKDRGRADQAAKLLRGLDNLRK